MRKQYPAKILIAWGEAIDGNKEINSWLLKNGYKELGMFTYALRNKDAARKWLMDKGFQHLFALINGAEGNGKAIDWLMQNDFEILARMAMAGDNEEAAFKWLLKNGHREFAVVADKIKRVKNEIERDNNDVHRISSE